ncbi:hypothetical protein [Sinorhizobium sp. RAC02]|uniref:hypothetical protein n=1 Tax=Sinorhizobium sp. RAC02 TaxID=1842534 RepID=UPI00083E083D|nr:hypothetical protein [Sinorhizobium sp. RAC02]AOF88490.1 hypothetical protein BSY16_1406 [Sinorhizobium sp. RAC02]
MTRFFGHRTKAGRRQLPVLLLAVVAALPLSAADSRLVERTAALQTAQAFGFRCATPQFVCQIPPAMLGSICFCGAFQGVVVP